MRSAIALGLLLLLGVAANAKTYEGYQVLRTGTLDQAAAAELRELEVNDLRFDFWKEARGGLSAEIMAAPEHLQSLKDLLDAAGVGYEQKVEDVQRLIEGNRKLKGRRINVANWTTGAVDPEPRYELDWDDYYPHAVINEFIEELAASNDWAEIVNIGQSYEGRDMKVLRTTKAGPGAPTVWFECGIHAREWISPAVCTYVIRELVENNAANGYADQINFHFLPVTNPDGYDYTFTDDRLWRKTRTDNQGSPCKGVDPNRNYGYHWGELGVSTNPCSDTYCGTEAFSEPSSKNNRDYVLSIDPVPTFATALHSAAELWLYPYGYMYNRYPDNVDEIRDLGYAAVEALEAVHGISFTMQNSAELYPASGDANDWYTHDVGIRFSYTIELRDQGFGFELPPEQIIPSGEEMWAAYQVCFDKVIEVNK